MRVLDIAGPPRLERARVRVTATVGQPRLILKCGVNSDIPPLIKWKFNGKLSDHVAYFREIVSPCLFRHCVGFLFV